MILSEIIKNGVKRLEEAGIKDASSDSKIFAMHAFSLKYSDIFMKFNEEMPENKTNFYFDCIKERCKRIPTQYIVGSTSFMGYEFKVKEGVLIPRPETEILVEKAIKLSKNKSNVRALDMCCGSGCIGISFVLLRKAMGYNADSLDAADISDAAVELTGINSKELTVKINIIKSDLFSQITGIYDIILSNPPYIRTNDIEGLEDEVKLHEPLLALDGYEDGLYFYREIIKAAKDCLNTDGIIVFEIGYDQYDDVHKLLDDAGFAEIELTRDYAGLERIVSAKKR